MTIGLMNAIITERSRDARVVELADSLDSGSSAHSGRAGSSPASRTSFKSAEIVRFRRFFFFVLGVKVHVGVMAFSDL